MAVEGMEDESNEGTWRSIRGNNFPQPSNAGKMSPKCVH